jgi:hypothetical protein
MKLPEERSYTPAPSGAFAAICISFIDMGTQETIYGPKRQVRLRWELPTELMADGRPFTISQTYTWSMSAKSRLRGDLESWRGKAFEAKDFGKDGFDTRKLLGTPCLLNIIHVDRNSTTYANISSLSPIPKGMEKPTNPRNALVYLALTEEDFDAADLEDLPERMKQQIKSSPEYNFIVNGVKPEEAKPAIHDDALDDSIPF